MRYLDCQQVWKVERYAEIDRAHDHAFKIADPARGLDFDEKPARVELLIRLHGRASANKCLQVGCDQAALADGVFRVHNANTGYVP